MTVAISFLFGLLTGSFLNVCIQRWPVGQSVVAPRSRCPRCKQTIAWRDNVPVLSYLLLRGRCRRCAARIALRYPIVELTNALLYAAIAAHAGWGFASFKMMLFSSMMIVLFFTDLNERILPDEITVGGVVIGVLLSPFVRLNAGLSDIVFLLLRKDPEPWLRSLAESILGAVLFGGVLFIVGEVYFYARGVDGLGLGDVKMAAMIAAFWGVPQTLFVLIAGSLAAALTGVLIVSIAKKDWKYALPFGSYLAAAAVPAMFWSRGILLWYWEWTAG